MTNNMGISNIVWSPDGTRIAFDSFLGNWDTFVINSDGSSLRKLTDSLLPPAKLRFNYLLAVLFPAMVHMVLLFGLLSSSLYIRRHTQQAIVLIGLRIVSTVLFVGLISGTECAWILVNGSLWLFGSLLGVWQVRNGDCWLMHLRGEKDLLPRFATVPVAPQSAVPSVAPSAPQVAETYVAPIATAVPAFSVPSDPSAALELGLALVAQSKREHAIECFMFVFRNGSPELRQRAVAEMEKLGEVENG